MLQRMRRTGILWLAALGCLLAVGCASSRAVLGKGQFGQGAELVLPPDVNVITLDRVRVKGQNYRPVARDAVINLEPGRHSVVVRYSVLWEFSEDHHETIESDPILLRFEVAKGDIARVVHDRARTYREHKRIAQAAALHLEPKECVYEPAPEPEKPVVRRTVRRRRRRVMPVETGPPPPRLLMGEPLE